MQLVIFGFAIRNKIYLLVARDYKYLKIPMLIKKILKSILKLELTQYIHFFMFYESL